MCQKNTYFYYSQKSSKVGIIITPTVQMSRQLRRPVKSHIGSTMAETALNSAIYTSNPCSSLVTSLWLLGTTSTKGHL
jgi:hypothetical protein